MRGGSGRDRRASARRGSTPALALVALLAGASGCVGVESSAEEATTGVVAQLRDAARSEDLPKVAESLSSGLLTGVLELARAPEGAAMLSALSGALVSGGIDAAEPTLLREAAEAVGQGVVRGLLHDPAALEQLVEEVSGRAGGALGEALSAALREQLGEEGDGPLSRALAGSVRRAAAGGVRGAFAELDVDQPVDQGADKTQGQALAELSRAVGLGIQHSYRKWQIGGAFLGGLAAGLVIVSLLWLLVGRRRDVIERREARAERVVAR